LRNLTEEIEIYVQQWKREEIEVNLGWFDAKVQNWQRLMPPMARGA